MTASTQHEIHPGCLNERQLLGTPDCGLIVRSVGETLLWLWAKLAQPGVHRLRDTGQHLFGIFIAGDQSTPLERAEGGELLVESRDR